jgi:hypothetical protein
MYMSCSDTYVLFCQFLSRWSGFQMDAQAQAGIMMRPCHHDEIIVIGPGDRRPATGFDFEYRVQSFGIRRSLSAAGLPFYASSAASPTSKTYPFSSHGARSTARWPPTPTHPRSAGRAPPPRGSRPDGAGPPPHFPPSPGRWTRGADGGRRPYDGNPSHRKGGVGG